jgi:hypothetical protein
MVLIASERTIAAAAHAADFADAAHLTRTFYQMIGAVGADAGGLRRNPVAVHRCRRRWSARTGSR